MGYSRSPHHVPPIPYLHPYSRTKERTAKRTKIFLWYFLSFPSPSHTWMPVGTNVVTSTPCQFNFLLTSGNTTSSPALALNSRLHLREHHSDTADLCPSLPRLLKYRCWINRSPSFFKNDGPLWNSNLSNKWLSGQCQRLIPVSIPVGLVSLLLKSFSRICLKCWHIFKHSMFTANLIVTHAQKI